MTLRVAIVGAGPAGFAVACALLADAELDVEITLVDRAARPDRLLRHGPAAGAQRLRRVATRVDSVLGDHRVRFYGNVDVGAAIGLDALGQTAHAVVLASGAPQDLPLDIAGRDSVGVGTVSHVEAWLKGNVDVEACELDLAMDSAVFVGVSPKSLDVAELLCGRTPIGISSEVASRLARNGLRHVQMVDPRPKSELELREDLPGNLVVRTELTPVGIVGRNRARAIRCVRPPDAHGRVVAEDLRAQLLLRPRAPSFGWSGIDGDRGHIAHEGTRVRSAGASVAGLYVAGWAGRDPTDRGSHAEDAAAVLAAIHADVADLSPPTDDLAAGGIEPAWLGGWSAVAATDVLLERFAGEHNSPVVDYDALMEQVDDD